MDTCLKPDHDREIAPKRFQGRRSEPNEVHTSSYSCLLYWGGVLDNVYRTEKVKKKKKNIKTENENVGICLYSSVRPAPTHAHTHAHTCHKSETNPSYRKLQQQQVKNDTVRSIFAEALDHLCCCFKDKVVGAGENRVHT